MWPELKGWNGDLQQLGIQFGPELNQLADGSEIGNTLPSLSLPMMDLLRIGVEREHV